MIINMNFLIHSQCPAVLPLRKGRLREEHGPVAEVPVRQDRGSETYQRLLEIRLQR